MTFLYNCKHAGDQYRITKFDEHMNVESSYLCTTKECECPAGHRPHCRHREMLPRFIQRGTIGTEWCYDYGRGGWVQMEMAALLPEEPEIIPAVMAEPEQIQRDMASATRAYYRSYEHEAYIPPALAPTLPAPKRSWRRF